MQSRFEQLWRATSAAIFQGAGHSSPQLRQTVGRGDGPEELRELVRKIHQEPWAITDQDWIPARSHHDQEQLFEVVVAATYGAASHRLECAMRALEQA